MGIMAKLFSNHEQHESVNNAMIAMLKDQSDKQHEMMLAMLATQKEQNETTRMILNQYMTKGENTATTLNDRLFHKEEALWDEVIASPFVGM